MPSTVSEIRKGWIESTGKKAMTSYIKQTFDMYDSGFRSSPTKKLGTLSFGFCPAATRACRLFCPQKAITVGTAYKKARHGRFDARGYGFDTSVKPSM